MTLPLAGVSWVKLKFHDFLKIFCCAPTCNIFFRNIYESKIIIVLFISGMLCAMLVLLMLGGLLIAIMGPSKWTVVAYGSAGALVSPEKFK